MTSIDPAQPSGSRRVLGPGDDILRHADFETLAIHMGKDPDPTTGAIIPPIYAASTYAQDAVGQPRSDYVYSRSANPTRRALETCVAALEGGSVGLAFASGVAAEDTVFRTVCRPGDHIIMPNDVYGGTFRLLDKVLTRWDVSYTPVPIWDASAVAAAIVPGKTKIIWCETPTNPLLGIADLRMLADLAHGAEALLAVDNTFASPYLQRPLDFGADIVVHSTTKYLGGHSDVVGGVVIAKDDELGATIKFHQNSMGGIASPFDSWLTLRGIKTLPVRMDRQCANAMRIADFLGNHAAVESVLYPGLSTHPGHEIAAKQMTAFGGVVSFTVRAGEDAAIQVCNSARLFTLAESLGAVESLISHPLRMTHASAAGTAAAPPANLVRLSVGLESSNDLIKDLDSALSSVR
jgi:cystathionine gamma-synthase